MISAQRHYWYLTNTNYRIFLLVLSFCMGTVQANEESGCEQQKELATSLLSNEGEFSSHKRPLSANFSCEAVVNLLELAQKPRVTPDIFRYEGGFRLTAKPSGPSEIESVDYSLGTFALNRSGRSIFIASNPRFAGIGEFLIPEIVQSEDISLFKVGTTQLQPFVRIFGTKRVDTGISGYFRITGIAHIDNSLIVNYINWYDANGSETDTTVMLWDAQNLTDTKMYGPYQLEGSAHAAGWISKVPSSLHELLEGTHITGSQPSASIISRLSVGPTAFAFDPRRSVIYAPADGIRTTPLLDFSQKTPLYDKNVYSVQPSFEKLITNEDKRNKLWTLSSGAAYGFIVPGTRTYLTIGKSGGHESGIGYKITQDNGHECGGPCPYAHTDKYSFYWAWDIIDLLRVKAGLSLPHELRPYAYGKFPIPNSFRSLTMGGADYDEQNGRLYISFPEGDMSGKYARPPLFLTFIRTDVNGRK